MECLLCFHNAIESLYHLCSPSVSVSLPLFVCVAAFVQVHVGIFMFG